MATVRLQAQKSVSDWICLLRLHDDTIPRRNGCAIRGHDPGLHFLVVPRTKIGQASLSLSIGLALDLDEVETRRKRRNVWSRTA